MRKYFFVLDGHKFSLWHRRKKVEQSRVKWWRLGFRTKVSAAVEPVAGQPHLPLNRSRRSGRYFRNSITNSSPETGISNFVIIFHQRKVAGATWNYFFVYKPRVLFLFCSFFVWRKLRTFSFFVRTHLLCKSTSHNEANLWNNCAIKACSHCNCKLICIFTFANYVLVFHNIFFNCKLLILIFKIANVNQKNM